jgi:hypothetical protein
VKVKYLSTTNDGSSKVLDGRIVPGKEYTVYALGKSDGEPLYYLYDEYCSYYPMFHSSPFFEITDNHPSRYWVPSKSEPNFLAYPEWALDDNYYGNLIDDEAGESRIFRHYKALMDLEFPDSTITEKAQIGDAQWLICPTCIDAWQSPDNLDAVVICPKCQNMLHNPRYQNINHTTSTPSWRLK